MNAHRFHPVSCLFALSAAAAMLGCASAVEPDSEATGATSQALCPVGVDCTPPPPPPPPPGAHVTITSDELETIVSTLLIGATLSVDTTETAPPLSGPPMTISNPAWVRCTQELAACNEEPFAERAFCRKEVLAECKGVPTSLTVPTLEYSYLAFSPLAHSYGMNDVFFPLQTLHHNGTFSFDIDINYVHATFGLNFSCGFQTAAASNSPVTAWMYLNDIQSNSPTAILSDPYPDVDFTNMAAGVTLVGLAPTADGQRIDYASVTSTFAFDWDVNDLPDWLVGEFVDVTSIVEDRVTTRLNNAFGADSSHAALSKALTTLVARDIGQAHPAGFSKLTQVVGAGSSILVYYTPN